MIIQRGSLPYYLCTILFLSFNSGCGMDRANDHLESMDKNTQRLNASIESYHQDVSQVAHSLENLSASLDSLQLLAHSMTTTLMGLMRPSADLPSDPVLEMPEVPRVPATPATPAGSVVRESSEVTAVPRSQCPEHPEHNEELAQYRRELSRVSREMAVLNETIASLRRQLLPLTNQTNQNQGTPSASQESSNRGVL